MGLNAKQKLFIHEYLVDKNAARAARVAGYKESSAREIGRQLLTKLDVSEAVNQGLKAQAERADITAERVMKELSLIAFQKLNTVELKKVSANKLKALELLGKHFKLFTEVQEVSGKDGGPMLILSLPDNGRLAPKDEDGGS